jgi:hypothetical protein
MIYGFARCNFTLFSTLWLKAEDAIIKYPKPRQLLTSISPLEFLSPSDAGLVMCCKHSSALECKFTSLQQLKEQCK